MKLLVDADFLVALVKENDINHRKAIERFYFHLTIYPFKLATLRSHKVLPKNMKNFEVRNSTILTTSSILICITLH